MKIRDDFIKNNDRIKIISNNKKPFEIPLEWRPVFDSCDILVAIPDLHMYIHRSNLDNFKYGENMLLHFLGYLNRLKRQLAQKGKTLRIYQLGDMYELRFPSIKYSGENVAPAEISLSHNNYSKILNRFESLRTHYLYGNHDFELRHYAGFRYGATEGKIMLEHGFAANTWSDFSNPGAALWEPAQLAFKTLRQIEQFFANLLVATKIIKRDEHFGLGPKDGAIERSVYPSEADYPAKQLEFYTERLKKQNKESNSRICILAHTHHPYLNTEIENGEYVLLDAGAWVEGRSDFAVITDEELAVCRYSRS